tara:strand:- start:1793 stop:2167 length:375 start_codon:yes stop_codon:yes gene_type:complete
LSAISLREFYVNNDSAPILPMGTSDTRGSSITVIYDQDAENMSGDNVILVVKEEYNTILETKEAVTISLKPGTYSVSISPSKAKTSTEKKDNTINLKDGDHKLWAVKVFPSHREAPKQDVIITL